MTKWHIFSIKPITSISCQIFSKFPYVCNEFLYFVSFWGENLYTCDACIYYWWTHECINIFCIYVNWMIVRFYLKYDKAIVTCKVKTIICKHTLYEFCTHGVNIKWLLSSWLYYYWLSLLWIIPPTRATTACNIRSIAKCINDFNKKRANNKINKWENELARNT